MKGGIGVMLGNEAYRKVESQKAVILEEEDEALSATSET